MPLAGISAAQLAEFQDGRAEFIKEERPEGGLGPIFNDVSCVACHDAGGVGGAGRKSVVRFGRVTDGVFDPLVHLGGSLLQKRSISRESLETIPREANVVATRITPPAVRRRPDRGYPRFHNSGIRRLAQARWDQGACGDGDRSG